MERNGKGRAVLFDLDGTLYDYDRAHEQGYLSVRRYARENFGMEEERFDELYRQTMAEIERRMGAQVAAIHDRYLRFQLMLEKEDLPLVPHVWGMNRAYWDVFLEHMVMSPGLYPCLRWLHREGYVLGICTNMTIDYQIRKLERLGIAAFFDFVVSSEEVNSEKPDPEIFLRSSEKAGCRPIKCLFVGDNLALDVQGAMNAGIVGVWYEPDEEKASRHPEAVRIGHYDELPAIVASWAGD